MTPLPELHVLHGPLGPEVYRDKANSLVNARMAAACKLRDQAARLRELAEVFEGGRAPAFLPALIPSAGPDGVAAVAAAGKHLGEILGTMHKRLAGRLRDRARELDDAALSVSRAAVEGRAAILAGEDAGLESIGTPRAYTQDADGTLRAEIGA